MTRAQPVRPPALLKGDTIGIVAPASNIDRAALAAGSERLQRLGYRPYYLNSIFDRDVYFAGSVERRVAELEHMFASPEVKAILCARGGYGSNHLLTHIEPEKLLKHPKPFIGYSDITTLLTYFADHGLVTFHGPMATKDFAHEGGVDEESWNAVLSSDSGYEGLFPREEVQPLVRGNAEGVLYGGCLSMLVASLGTPYEIKAEGSILFIEDVNAKPFQVDRMLMHLKLAGKLRNVRGIVFGQMLDCLQSSVQDYTLQEVIVRTLADLQVPIAYGVRSGHVTSGNRTLPMGVLATLSVGDDVRLRCQPAVTPRETETTSSKGRTA